MIYSCAYGDTGFLIMRSPHQNPKRNRPPTEGDRRRKISFENRLKAGSGPRHNSSNFDSFGVPLVSPYISVEVKSPINTTV